MAPKNSDDKKAIRLAGFLVAKHRELIQQVQKEILSIISNESVETPGPDSDGIVEAKNAELKELEDQLQNYKNAVARTTDIQVAQREAYRFSNRLPALAKRNEIDKCIDDYRPENRFLIVQGETGSGKSTQLPQYLADHPRMKGKKIICTQPRKIAAISLAERVGLEFDCGKQKKFGKQVGYSVGGSRPKSSRKTRIEYMTEGRMLELVVNRRHEDFSRIGAIILDEAHERSITCDILLGTLKKNDPLWNSILIVVSSATIDLEAFSKFFEGQAQIIKIAGRMYPVRRIHKPLPEVESRRSDLGENGEIIKAVAKTALEIHNNPKSSGDILCFLPGADEIHKAAVWFETHVKPGILIPKIYELSGSQEASEQKAVFETLCPKTYRKIIFASPIAETSVTIDGVVYVVDSGYKKEMTYDPQRNISALKTVMISRSSSLQREGRAGRTQPGVCYKLYSEEDFDNMNVNHLPEILRSPLPLAIIYLRRMGIDPVGFDWISAPLPEAIKLAEEELVRLGALDGAQRLPTDLGNLISDSQQDPKVARMIYAGILKDAGKAAIRIAALLSVSRYFFSTGGKDADEATKKKLREQQTTLSNDNGDVLTLYKLYREFETLTDDMERDGKTLNYHKKQKLRLDWIQSNAISRKAIQTAEANIRDLEYIFSRVNLWKRNNGSQNSIPSDEEVLQLFCAGYFLNAARRVNVKRRGQNNLHYFALETGVVGCLSFKSSMAQKGNAGPDWIIYDQIFKLHNITIFPASSRIELDWIKNENECFYNDCVVKQETLRTEVVEIKESESVLRRVLGKRLVNLSSFEDQLNCSLDVDLYNGLLRAFCTKAAVDYVELSLKSEVEHAKNYIRKETFEQQWLGGTRLVIGSGYEIVSVLSSGEFNTICLLDLDRNLADVDFENLIHSKIDEDKIACLQLIRLRHSSKGEVQFTNPEDANFFLRELRRDYRIAPCVGNPSNVACAGAPETTLKITWPLGPSKGTASIFLTTPQDGNKVLDYLRSRFPLSKVDPCGDKMAYGLSTKAQVYRIGKALYKFWESDLYTSQTIFKIKVRNLPKKMDEFQLAGLLKQIVKVNSTNIIIDRDVPEEIAKNPPHLSAAEKNAKIAPLKTILENCGKLNISPSFNKPARRAGIIVYCSDPMALEKNYKKIRETYSKQLHHDQPHQVQLERLMTFSVCTDLYVCLRSKFKEAISEIKKMKVHVMVKDDATVKNSHFVYIKYRITGADTMWSCQRIFEKAMERDVVDKKSCPNVENLFTRTGQILAKDEIPASVDYYIQWNHQKHQIYIYAVESEVKKGIRDKFVDIADRIQKWKVAEYFEVCLMLDRKEVEKTGSSLCQQLEFFKGNYRFVGKNKLVVSTDSAEDFQGLKVFLTEKNLLWEERVRTLSSTGECEICFCEVDEKFILTSLCNHAFCLECIKHMFTGLMQDAGVQEMPLRCPANGCGQLIPVEDIKKVAPPESLQKLNETALNIFLKSENCCVRYCPKPGCNQIFKPKAFKIADSEPSIYSCDNCLNNFCLDCSVTLEKEILMHPDLHCSEVRSKEYDLLTRLKNQVMEILTLHCPRCKAAFFDYSGCAALSCASCPAKFCALCLKDCGIDAHAHVVLCPYNFQRVGVFVSVNSVKEANRLLRIDKLNSFFRNSPDLRNATEPDIKSSLLESISRDLSDFGISKSEIKLQPLRAEKPRRENNDATVDVGQMNDARPQQVNDRFNMNNRAGFYANDNAWRDFHNDRPGIGVNARRNGNNRRGGCNVL